MAMAKQLCNVVMQLLFVPRVLVDSLTGTPCRAESQEASCPHGPEAIRDWRDHSGACPGG